MQPATNTILDDTSPIYLSCRPTKDRVTFTVSTRRDIIACHFPHDEFKTDIAGGLALILGRAITGVQAFV